MVAFKGTMNNDNHLIGSKLEWQSGFLDPEGSMAVINRLLCPRGEIDGQPSECCIYTHRKRFRFAK